MTDSKTEMQVRDDNFAVDLMNHVAWFLEERSAYRTVAVMEVISVICALIEYLGQTLREDEGDLTAAYELSAKVDLVARKLRDANVREEVMCEVFGQDAQGCEIPEERHKQDKGNAPSSSTIN